MSVGETTNLMSIDTQKFMDLMLYLNMAWASPLQIALAMFFLWQILGPSAMAGKTLCDSFKSDGSTGPGSSQQKFWVRIPAPVLIQVFSCCAILFSF